MPTRSGGHGTRQVARDDPVGGGVLRSRSVWLGLALKQAEWVCVIASAPDNAMYDGGETTEFQLLLDGWAGGDVAARDRLLDRAGQRLLALTRRMLRGYPHLRRWEQTDDVFQNAVLRLYRSLGDVRPESIGEFFGLAATQIRRTLIDLARHHFGPEGAAARHHSEAGGGGANGRSDSDFAHDDEPPETLDAWARFHEAVEALPRDEREAFSLIWYGEATQAEASKLLGVTERTISRRLVRARLLLHESLKNVRSCFEEANEHGS